MVGPWVVVACCDGRDLFAWLQISRSTAICQHRPAVFHGRLRDRIVSISPGGSWRLPTAQGIFRRASKACSQNTQSQESKHHFSPTSSTFSPPPLPLPPLLIFSLKVFFLTICFFRSISIEHGEGRCGAVVPIVVARDMHFFVLPCTACWMYLPGHMWLLSRSPWLNRMPGLCIRGLKHARGGAAPLSPLAAC